MFDFRRRKSPRIETQPNLSRLPRLMGDSLFFGLKAAVFYQSCGCGSKCASLVLKGTSVEAAYEGNPLYREMGPSSFRRVSWSLQRRSHDVPALARANPSNLLLQLILYDILTHIWMTGGGICSRSLFGLERRGVTAP